MHIKYKLIVSAVFFSVLTFCVHAGIQIKRLPDSSKVTGVTIDGGQIKVDYHDGSSRIFKLYLENISGSSNKPQPQAQVQNMPQPRPENLASERKEIMRRSRSASMASQIRSKGNLCLAHRQRRSLNRIKLLGEDKYHVVEEGEPFYVAKLNSKFYACDMSSNVYEADQQIENNLFNILVPATDYLRALNKEMLRMEAMIQENNDAVVGQFQESKQLFNDYMTVLHNEKSKALETYNPKTGNWTENANISKFSEKSKQTIDEIKRRKKNLDLAIANRQESVKILQANLGHLVELRETVMKQMQKHNVKIDNFLKKFPEFNQKH
ncbi:MAG: hypothetical protein GY750_09385 [Lentisphaerae bacterium]|nr:hypothetical protein [Lentisphaerota bacterium]MCP4101624.1 hypothetical protein [Lentisphaerota bacterium]